MSDGKNELANCRFCGQQPGQKVGPPALARCVTPDCEGKNLGAETLADWNTLNRSSASAEDAIEKLATPPSQPAMKAVEAFHPDKHLPGCMMPDGGDCCEGHAAVCEDWHKQRREIECLRAQLASARKALEIADDFAGQVVSIEDIRHNDETRRIAETYREIFRNALAALTK